MFQLVSIIIGTIAPWRFFTVRNWQDQTEHVNVQKKKTTN